MVTYYVAKTGNDSNDGSQGSPWLTIGQGTTTMAASDTLIVRAGTYTEAISYVAGNVPPSGTSWGAATRIQAAIGEEVVLNGSGALFGLGFNNSAYLEFTGLILDDFSQGFFCGTSGANRAHHIRFQDGKIRNIDQQGINFQQPENDFCEVLRSQVYDIGTTSLHHGAYFRGPDHLIDGCEFWNCAGYSVHIYTGDVSRCVVRGTIMRDGVRGLLVTAGDDMQVYNNLIYDNSFLGAEVNYSSGGDNIQFYNNTIVGNGTFGLRLNDPPPTITNAIVQNNIAYNHSTNFYDGGTNTTASNNLFDGTNPLFVDLANKDFHLQASSPGIDAGTTIAVVTTDLDGIPRPQGIAYDIGAYETGGIGGQLDVTLGALTLAATGSLSGPGPAPPAVPSIGKSLSAVLR